MPPAIGGASWERSVPVIAEWVAFAGIWALLLWSLVERAARRRRRPPGSEGDRVAPPKGHPGRGVRRGRGLRRWPSGPDG